MRKKLIHPLVPVLCLAAFAIALVSTKGGVGLDEDAVFYVTAAENMVSQGQLAAPFGAEAPRPLTHYGAGFPLTLALFGYVGLPPLEGARWINALLFGLNAWLAAYIVFRVTARPWPAVFTAFLMLASTAMLSVHTRAWSEPGFLFLTFSCLWLLSRALETERLRTVLAASVCAALALLFRYAGVSILFTGAAAILLWFPGGWKRKLLASGVFASIPVIAAGAISAWNASASGAIADRQIVLHPIEPGRFLALLNNLSAWLLPEPTPLLVRIAALFLVAFACIVAARGRRAPAASGRMQSLLLLFAASYLATLFLSIALVDVAIQFGYRILAPLFISAVLLVMIRLAGLDAPARPWLRYASRAALAVFALICLTRSVAWVKRSTDAGLGWSSPRWKQSEIVRSVREIDARRPVYTNAAAAMYILTGRPVRDIPRKLKYTSGLPRPAYQSEIHDMRRQLQMQNGVVVYLNVYGDVAREFGMKQVTSWPSEQELSALMPLREIRRAPDGVIFELGHDSAQ